MPFGREGGKVAVGRYLFRKNVRYEWTATNSEPDPRPAIHIRGKCSLLSLSSMLRLPKTLRPAHDQPNRNR
jgi:hypothetical protein